MDAQAHLARARRPSGPFARNALVLLRNLSDLSLEDVKTLCDDGALESRFLDFKAGPIGGGEKDKREFRADVCAFANASGGDLVLGVQTKDGAADEICGIDVADPDKETQRLINLVRDGLEPRISGLDTKWLPMAGTRGVMIVRVPRSWSAPDRVKFLKDMNFFVRNPVGKHPMSVDELRRAFNLSSSIAERMRALRSEREQAIATYQLPFDVRRGPKIAVLIVPLSTMVDPLDVEIQVEQRPREVVRPVANLGSTHQYCFEGVAMITRDNPASAYALMFRTGAVEFVSPK